MRRKSARRLLVRTDASAAIGTGHLVRCLTLADELAARGWSVQFATRSLPPELSMHVRGRGYTQVAIPDDVPMDDEPRHLAVTLDTDRPDVTIIDHYAIDAGWHRAAASWAGVLMAIDDLAAKRLAVELMLNQNLGVSEDSYQGLVEDSCRRLVGPRYALLRPQFPVARGDRPRPRKEVKRLLVFMSGADLPDATALAARAAARLGVPTDVVVGAAYPHLDRLRQWAAGEPHVTIRRDVADMAALMERADLAIGAPSSASWERCCLGVPTILMTLADNQVRVGRALAKAGAAVDLGWFHDIAEDRLAAEIADLAAAGERLEALSEHAASVTDGQGTVRVADAVELLGRGGR